ncbi:hypothetical protein E4656_06730 [Natronospirillum operosum]|uniref:Uncharacterized protein n=1 Tax=Natronospirillum operosum TaxID=2759953 RepID=A0A4Z0WGV8_9GAMM|nr:hypothetical protein [Natronospirillum operosum]TGG93880.1 hypothetical protein E4656_06730 [Natronospirillum operosum]
MADTLTWQVWADEPWLSLLTWLVLAVVLATLIRPVVIRVSEQIFRVIRFTLSKVAARVQGLAQRIQAHNDAMLVNLGQNYLERQIHRQGLQLRQALEHDLAMVEPQGVQLKNLVERMEDDYASTREPVVEPPEWYRAAEGLLETRAAHEGNRTLQHLLEQLLERVQEESRHSRQDYRQAIAERHQLLNQFLPYWRRLLRMQGDIGQGVKRIEQRAQRLEMLLERYEASISDSSQPTQRLIGSVLVQFLVALLVFSGVLLLGVASFWSFSAGTALLVPQVSTANIMVVSMALICAQVLTGMVLLENLQVTRLFRALWVLDARTSRILRLAALGGLGLWSVLNGALAWLSTLREWEDLLAPGVGSNGVIFVRVMLAALTPWVLMLLVIPLEPLLNGLRIMLGQVVATLVWLLAWSIRLLTLLVRAAERLWLGFYEVVCAPLTRALGWLGQFRRPPPPPGAETKPAAKTAAKPMVKGGKRAT